MELAVLNSGMAHTSFFHKLSKGPGYGLSVLVGLRWVLALTFLAIAIALFREGANRSTWVSLMLYLIAFVITDRVAFAVRLRILHREDAGEHHDEQSN